jgi:predicted NBD/HSP70 family sugar kinase
MTLSFAIERAMGQLFTLDSMVAVTLEPGIGGGIIILLKQLS